MLGGVLTIGGNLLIERRRQKGVAKAEQIADGRLLRQSVRMVLEELARAQNLLVETAKHDSPWPARQLQADAWARHARIWPRASLMRPGAG